MRGQFGKSILPTHYLEIGGAAGPPTLERIGEAVRMIEHLKGGMAPGAEFAAVDRVLRIAFELFCQAHLDQAGAAVAHDFGIAFHDAHESPAAGGTERAYARFPGGDSGNEIFVGNETDELLLGAAAGLESRHGAREGRNFEKVTALHVSYLSGDAQLALSPSSTIFSQRKLPRDPSLTLFARDDFVDRRKLIL